MPALPTPAFSNPAATLPGEADILANVLADLSDDHAKLVYADWLEDRDDPRGPLLRNFLTAYRAGTKLPDVTSAPEPWRDVIGLTLIDEASEELARHTDTFLRLARPAFRLEMHSVPDEEIPVGASKFGGRPDMPAEVEWPVWEDGEYVAHDFKAQFNLADLSPSPVASELPSSGVLSFFHESSATSQDCVGGWRVFHFCDPSQLIRREPPSSPAPWRQSPPEVITFTEMLTLPQYRNSPFSNELGLKDDEQDLYGDLHSAYFESHLLGHARPIHSDVEEGKDDRLLLQLALGRVLYFTIRADDLRRRQFDRVGFGWER